jgi:Cysteine-rich secretory protein family
VAGLVVHPWTTGGSSLSRFVPIILDMPPHHVARPRWRCLPLLVVLAVLGGWGAAGASHAQLVDRASATAVAADPGTEAQFVSRINSLRASKGVRQLQVHGELTGVARRWTDRMVANGQISHNPNLGSQVSGGWTKLGENVGVGHDVDGLMQAFINSPSHYGNLVDPAWTHVGVGVTFASDGRMYTTHNFMALSGGGAPPPPPPAPPPSPRPTPTTSPPTTAPPPPTTTTTAPPPPPEPTQERVTAVLEPLRHLESR